MPCKFKSKSIVANRKVYAIDPKAFSWYRRLDGRDISCRKCFRPDALGHSNGINEYTICCKYLLLKHLCDIFIVRIYKAAVFLVQSVDCVLATHDYRMNLYYMSIHFYAIANPNITANGSDE